MVIVSPSGAGRPATESYAGGLGHIGERAVVVVVIKPILAKICYINVGPSVVIVISHRHTKAPALIRNAGLGSNVSKGSVMIVVEEHRSWGGFFALQRKDRGSLEQVNIQPAVPVVIK